MFYELTYAEALIVDPELPGSISREDYEKAGIEELAEWEKVWTGIVTDGAYYSIAGAGCASCVLLCKSNKIQGVVCIPNAIGRSWVISGVRAAMQFKTAI